MIKQTPLADINPYEKNAKKHPKKQIAQIAQSIREFGFNQPIVLDKKGVIIVGHGRFEAAKQLGLKEVPTITVDISEAKARAYRLADNKLNESDWDMQLVVEELKELNLSGLDITLTGFSMDNILDNKKNDDYAPAPPDEPKSRLGEIYQLGNHRVMCGDSTNKEHVVALMDGIKADMVFSDPPYNVDYSGRGEKTSNKIMNDKMTPEQFQAFLNAVMTNFAAHTKEGGLGIFSTAAQLRHNLSLQLRVQAGK